MNRVALAMKRFSALLVFAACGLLPRGDAAAPANNWVLPIFSDKEGYRVMTARGSEAGQNSDKSYTVTDLNITVFAGDATGRVETIFLSPLARFTPKDKLATGDKTVRVIRDDLEATGTRWVYNHAQKHVTLDGNVRIVFNAEIKDLLK